MVKQSFKLGRYVIKDNTKGGGGGGGGGGCDGVLLNAMVWKAVEFVSILTRFWNFLYESPLFLVNDNLGIRFQFFRILG